MCSMSHLGTINLTLWTLCDDCSCLWRHTDVIGPRKTLSITPGPHSGDCCQTVAIGLSQRLHGRFGSFLAGKLIWLGSHHTQKSIILRSIYQILEGFYITMATLLNFSKFLFRDDDLRPIEGLSAKFHQNPSWNSRGVRWHSHKRMAH